MKALHLSIIVILSVIACSMVTLHAYGVPPISPQAEYFNSDVVLIGKVISATPFSPTHMKYEIQVEQYLKNPQPQDKMTVIADGTNKTLVERGMAPDTVFDVGQRAFLYLKNNQGNYTVWWFSHSTDSLCDPAPTQTDLNIEYPKGVDFGYDPLHIDASKSNSYLFAVNQPVIISYDTWNRHFTTTTFDVEFDVKNGTDGKKIFNDIQHITLKPCLGHQTVTTSFIPKIAGTYEVDVIFDNSLLGRTLEIPQNHSQHVSTQESPLKQLESGIIAADVKCKDNFQLVIKKSDSSPACVKPQTATKLVERGWAVEEFPHIMGLLPFGIHTETKTVVSIGNKINGNGLVPITINQVTSHADSRESITDWNFLPISLNGDNIHKTWDALPNPYYISYTAVDGNNNDVSDNSRMPYPLVVTAELRGYSATCDSEKIMGEGGHPVPIPIKRGNAIVFVKDAEKGILPDSNGEYAMKFMSLFETKVEFPKNAEIISNETKSCSLENKIDNFTKAFYSNVIFKLG